MSIILLKENQPTKFCPICKSYKIARWITRLVDDNVNLICQKCGHLFAINITKENAQKGDF